MYVVILVFIFLSSGEKQRKLTVAEKRRRNETLAIGRFLHFENSNQYSKIISSDLLTIYAKVSLFDTRLFQKLLFAAKKN